MDYRDKIVIVDDETIVLDLVRTYFAGKLNGHGRNYSFHDFQRVSEALDFLQKHYEETALVVSDRNIPSNDEGIGFVQEIKKRFPGLLSVMYWGGDDDAKIDLLVKEGIIEGHVKKPDTPKLVDLARKVLSHQ